jgi:pimeloyl-ACP methyl ester carboxylesterase
MQIICDRAVQGSEAPPLILLPGANMHAADFVDRGFTRAARETGALGDIAAVETGMEAYLDGSIVGRIHDAAMDARSGTGRVWLAGISLGGLGALLYARAHPEAIAGLLLLSPFIGTRGTISQVIAAGGLAAWEPPGGGRATDEHRLLHWLKSYRSTDTWWPEFYLGYGDSDRYAAAYRLLATILPDERVETVAGGHDWETWTLLWHRLLLNAQLRAH